MAGHPNGCKCCTIPHLYSMVDGYCGFCRHGHHIKMGELAAEPNFACVHEGLRWSNGTWVPINTPRIPRHADLAEGGVEGY